MAKNWRISSISGALLALYFIPVWTMIAFQDHGFADPGAL